MHRQWVRTVVCASVWTFILVLIRGANQTLGDQFKTVSVLLNSSAGQGISFLTAAISSN